MSITRPNGETAARRRHVHVRSCAEVLRLLALKPGFDGEARDMAAFLAFNLRAIYETIDESALAWDDRNYWKKAEALREKWRWSRTAADELERLILADRWPEVPGLLVELVPRFSDVTISEVTRDGAWWCGALKALRKRSGREAKR